MNQAELVVTYLIQRIAELEKEKAILLANNQILQTQLEGEKKDA